MPPSSSAIRTTIDRYLDRHPDERDALAGLLAALDRPVDVTARTTLPGHVTCSAVVIDSQRRALHIRHRAIGDLMLVPGGCVEPGDRTLLAAALRAVSQEAGIAPGVLCLTPEVLGVPIDVAVQDSDASPSKGDPAGRIYDFRYAFYLVDEQHPPVTVQDEEVSGAQWLSFAEVTSPTLRAKLLGAQLDGQPEPVNASVLIHNGAGSYLLHLRDDRPGIWQPWTLALLGGGRERGDASLEDTLRRELSEEVPGLRLEELEPYAVEEDTSVDGLHVSVQVFTGRWKGNPDLLDLREGVLLHWSAPDQLERLRLSPGLAGLIRRHAAEHPREAQPDAAPQVWDGGSRTVLNGIGVHLHLQDDQGRILLGLRHPDVRYARGSWHYLAGCCEHESVKQCAVREAEEELGLLLSPEHLDLVHTVHLLDPDNPRPLVELIFRVTRWSGEPQLMEPDKCSAWAWWPKGALPQPIVPYAKAALEGIAAGRTYTELGWPAARLPSVIATTSKES